MPDSMVYVTIASESSGVFFSWDSWVFTSHKHLCASPVGVKDFTPVKQVHTMKFFGSSSTTIAEEDPKNFTLNFRILRSVMLHCSVTVEVNLPYHILSSFVMANRVSLLFANVLSLVKQQI